MNAEVATDRLGFLLSDNARLFRAAFEREVATAGLGITPGEARALARIATRNGARQSEIADELGIEPMTLSRYLDKLQQAGLIERRTDPRDGRARRIHTTEQASAVVVAIRRHADELIDTVQKDLTGEQIETLRAALKIMRSNFLRLTPG